MLNAITVHVIRDGQRHRVKEYGEEAYRRSTASNMAEGGEKTPDINDMTMSELRNTLNEMNLPIPEEIPSDFAQSIKKGAGQ